ncbi:MAG TPA: hypothetical protein VGR37_18865 [Longimicrobiaceae bacterium]|nr:hypothetical protein [Longimicrobiaceae bacterium]
MRRFTWMAALTAVATLSACDATPTAAPGAARLQVTAMSNQAPVAVLELTRAKPMIVNGHEVLRHYLTGVNSYDPDGSIASYYWSSSCVYVPDGYSSTYTVDVRMGDTCEVNLYVTDNLGAQGRDTAWFTH